MNTELQPRYEYKFINSRFLVVDKSYQRVLLSARVKQIVSKFNPYLVNAIKVSCRADGKYYVFDGQHTLAALKLKNGNQDTIVECKVYYDLPYEDECILFAEQTGISKKVEINAKFKALYQAGDKDIVGLHDLLKSIGIELGLSNSKGVNRIVCLSTMSKIYKKLSAKEFADMLIIIRDAWGGIAESYNREIIEGMYLFYVNYKNQFDREKAVKQFNRVAPSVIIRDGRASISGGNVRFARQLLQAYNKNLSTKRLPDTF